MRTVEHSKEENLKEILIFAENCFRCMKAIPSPLVSPGVWIMLYPSGMRLLITALLFSSLLLSHVSVS